MNPKDRALYEQYVFKQKKKRWKQIVGLLAGILSKIPTEPILHFCFPVVSSPIGGGKSTMVRQLAPLLQAEAHYEQIPKFLGEFYGQMKRFERAVVALMKNDSPKNRQHLALVKIKMQDLGFCAQDWFLGNRFGNHTRIIRKGVDAVLDRSIYEDVLFALLLYLQDEMSLRQLETYLTILENHLAYLRMPTAIIYLDADLPTYMGRIMKRLREDPSRKMEEGLPKYYEQLLMELYEVFRQYYPGPIININTIGVDLTSDLRNEWAWLAKTLFPVLRQIMQKEVDPLHFRANIDFAAQVNNRPLIVSRRNGNGGNGHSDPTIPRVLAPLVSPDSGSPGSIPHHIAADQLSEAEQRHTLMQRRMGFQPHLPPGDQSLKCIESPELS